MTVSRVDAVLAAMVCGALVAGAPPAEAADSPVGTYVKKEEAGKPAMTMTIEQWAPGKAKLTYHIKDPPIVLTIVSRWTAANPRC